MRRRTRWLVAAAVTGLAGVALAVALWPGDADRLQGAWAGGGARVTFAGDLAAPESGAPGPRRLYFRLDPRASPKRIVLWDADGPNLRQPPRVLGVAFGTPAAGGPEWEWRGLYELDGDRLRLCLPVPGADFPPAFDPAAGAVFDLRRE
jgi:uncharacterized protein (TIGR03067 family)